MADAIAKAVWSQLVDNWTRPSKPFDLMTDLSGSGIKKGDSIDIPTQAAPTNTSATSRAAPESLTPTVDTLLVDQDAFYNVNLPRRTTPQYLEGSWPAATAKAMLGHMTNVIDDNLLNYLNFETAWVTGTTATYHVNAAADALTDNDVAQVEAQMLDASGVRREDLIYIFGAYGLGAIRGIADYVPGAAGSESGRLGIPAITHLNGIPVYLSQGISRNRTVATTGVSISSNVATATVASGHGIGVGQLITIADVTDPLTSAAAVSDTTATTVVVALTADDGAMADGTGTITVVATENLLVDTNKVWVAKQEMPDVESVKDFESAARALQAYAAFARISTSGAVFVLNTSASTV